jgi:hypothetical protein
LTFLRVTHVTFSQGFQAQYPSEQVHLLRAPCSGEINRTDSTCRRGPKQRRARRRTPPAIGAHPFRPSPPQQPSPLAEAKARFAASRDLAPSRWLRSSRWPFPPRPASWYCQRSGPILVTFGKFSEPARKAAIRPVHLRVTTRPASALGITTDGTSCACEVFRTPNGPR